MIIEKTDENLKRLIRGSDLWASECTYEKTWYHYASDEQGSIIFVADENEIKNRYEYDAFGNAVICEEKVENRYKYTGQQYDPVTQQYYLRARYYNPVIARFTQEDAYRGDGLNLYAYCDNNSVKYYDPSGYCGESKDPLKPNNKSANDSGGNNNSPTNRSANTDGRNNSSENQPKKPQAETPSAGRENRSGNDVGNVSTNQYGVDASKLKFSKTAENHFYDLNPRDTVIKIGDGKITRTYKGESNRPYVNSNGTTSLLDEIMNGGVPKPDRSLPNGLRWDVPGEFNGKSGTWELVIDRDTNTVVHFLFSSK